MDCNCGCCVTIEVDIFDRTVCDGGSSSRRRAYGRALRVLHRVFDRVSGRTQWRAFCGGVRACDRWWPGRPPEDIEYVDV